MKKSILFLIATLAVMMTSCGDSGTAPTTTPPPPAPTTTVPSGPSQATIVTRIMNPVVFTQRGTQFFTFDMEISESGGLGADINFARLELFRATGEFLERKEVGSGAIAAGVGDNRLEAGATETAAVLFTFTAAIKTGRMVVLLVDFTDDRGNNIQTETRFVFT